MGAYVEDSGYPQHSWLLTLILNATNHVEERYNQTEMKARNTVEKCIDLTKERFRCLLKHRTLNNEPPRAVNIITCTIFQILIGYG